MNEWILEFVREVDAIDYFFVDKLKEYVRNFVDIQRSFLAQKMQKAQKKNAAASRRNSVSNKKKENTNLNRKYLSPIDGTEIGLNSKKSIKNMKAKQKEDGDDHTPFFRNSEGGPAVAF